MKKLCFHPLANCQLLWYKIFHKAKQSKYQAVIKICATSIIFSIIKTDTKPDCPILLSDNIRKPYLIECHLAQWYHHLHSKGDLGFQICWCACLNYQKKKKNRKPHLKQLIFAMVTPFTVNPPPTNSQITLSRYYKCLLPPKNYFYLFYIQMSYFHGSFG